MDIRCATCQEPWDVYHLQHDEVHETEAGTAMIMDNINHEEYLKLMTPQFRKMVPFRPEYSGEPWENKLTPFWREQFAKLRWEFGTSHMVVLRCPCCPKDGTEDSEAADRREEYTQIGELLEGDDDGIASSLAD